MDETRCKQRMEKVIDVQRNSTNFWVKEFYKYQDRSSALNAAVALGKLQCLINCYSSLFSDSKLNEMFSDFEEAYEKVMSWSEKLKHEQR